MPKVSTYLSFRDYQKLKERAKQQNISPYKLQQDYILYCLNDNTTKNTLTLLQRLKRIIEAFDNLP